MKPKPTLYRQGDVLLERVKNIPDTAKPVTTDGKIILAHGEVTGHAHTIDSPDSLLMEDSGVTYLDVRQAMAALVHQEHATVDLPVGTYRVTRQREYSPEAIRNVAD